MVVAQPPVNITGGNYREIALLWRRFNELTEQSQ
jgi:hypothetical protein